MGWMRKPKAENQYGLLGCPLCGREMTGIETNPGRGELYCGVCDLTIGGNEAKTPDELTALLGQGTCRNISEPPSGFLRPLPVLHVRPVGKLSEVSE